MTAGQRATFAVSASNATGYQWKKNQADFPGATAAILEINSTTPAMNGDRFAVVVTGPGGSLTSQEAVLGVHYYSITAHPQDAGAMDGGSASFSAQGIGNPTVVTHQWQRAEPGLDTFADLAGRTQESLALSPLGYATDHGVRLRRKDVHATGTYFTNSATLTMVAVAPTISLEPQDRTVQVAQSATFSVDYSGTTGTIQWFRKPVNAVAAPIPGATGKTCSHAPADVSESGDAYYAVVNNPRGSATTRQAKLTVTPLSAPPHFTLQPQDQTGHINQTVTFTAIASGVPTPSYQWKRNGAEIPGATGSTVSVRIIGMEQEGDLYLCTAKNGVGADVDSKVARLHALPALVSPWFISQAANQIVAEGGDAVFTWQAGGNPAPNGAVEEYRSPSWVHVTAGFDFVIRGVRSSDSGRRFRCTASNSEGSAASVEAVLTVSNKNLPPTGVGITGSNHGVIGHPRVYALTGTDPEGEAVTFTTTTPNAVISGNLLTYKPMDIGTQVITVTCSDGENSVTASLPVTIVANQSPVFYNGGVGSGTYTYSPSAPDETINMNAADVDGDKVTYTISGTWPSWATLNSTTGQVTIKVSGVPAVDLGVAKTLNLSALDGYGGTTTGTVNVIVNAAPSVAGVFETSDHRTDRTTPFPLSRKK